MRLQEEFTVFALFTDVKYFQISIGGLNQLAVHRQAFGDCFISQQLPLLKVKKLIFCVT